MDTFHSYVQPTWQPKLTEFCIALTGITQVQLSRTFEPCELTAGNRRPVAQVSGDAEAARAVAGQA